MARTLTSARRAVRELEIGQPAADWDCFASCQLVLIAVAETGIENVVEKLARAGFSFERKIVLHTSRVRCSSILAPLQRRGAAIGSLLPIYTFQRPVPSLARVHCVVEGDALAVRMARRLVRAWEAEVQLVQAEERIHLAVATSIISDVFTGLLESAVQSTTLGGFSRKRALAALSELIAATVHDYERSGRRSRPGPLLQGDSEIVRSYVRRLEAVNPRAAGFYRRAARLALEAYERTDEGFSFLDREAGGDSAAFGAAAGAGGKR
jgi:predicted short-subunit dehydrogenase-like oxidoreductase (DUF2520 family)